MGPNSRPETGCRSRFSGGKAAFFNHFSPPLPPPPFATMIIENDGDPHATLSHQCYGLFMRVQSINHHTSHSRHGAVQGCDNGRPACFSFKKLPGSCALAPRVDEDCRWTEPQQAGDTKS